MSPQNDLAIRLRELHQPGRPVVFANVYDGATAGVVAAAGAKAVATASYAIAETYGVPDAQLTREQNLDAIARIGSVVASANLPLSVDLQDGYDDVSDTITAAIRLGAVGCNIEDVDGRTEAMRSPEDAVHRIKIAMAAAAAAGVPDFVINARTDILLHGGSVEDAIARGKAFLGAGAAAVFLWGGSKRGGVRADEVRKVTEALQGRVSVKMNLRPGFLRVQEIRDLGVCRISVGPELYLKAMDAFKTAAVDMLGQ